MTDATRSANAESAPRDWLIRKAGFYYRPDCRGYTAHVQEAGRYTEDFAKRQASMQPDIMEAVPLEQALRDYTDTDMVSRWMHQQHRRVPKRGGIPLWAKVSEEFCIGSTSAQAACRRHGIDPDAKVKKS